MLSRSSDSLEHLKNARIFFERGMAREAAAKATERDLEELREILERQRRALGKAEEFISADMQFHTRIARISGNPIFVAVSEAMLAWLKEYHTDMLIWTGKEKFTLVEHEKIVDRLAAADAGGAEVAMLVHLERSSALYVK
jgi:DNA-binding FadR family transcriptional regulator